jgi:hypothetical protein
MRPQNLLTILAMHLERFASTSPDLAGAPGPWAIPCSPARPRRSSGGQFFDRTGLLAARVLGRPFLPSVRQDHGAAGRLVARSERTSPYPLGHITSSPKHGSEPIRFYLSRKIENHTADNLSDRYYRSSPGDLTTSALS